jgi:hypothetical protein
MKIKQIRQIITLMLVLLLAAQCLPAAKKKKKEVLFPKREYVKRHSEVFFKSVSLTSPVVAKVEFFAKSQAYLSAYMAFSPYIAKHAYLKKLLPRFEKDNKEAIELFNGYKKQIKIENRAHYIAKLKITRLKLYLLLLYTLDKDYQGNALSGDDCFRYWNILLMLTKKAYKDKSKSTGNAALLTVSSHLVFFKKHKKWQKKAKKILKKTKHTAAPDKDAQLVLSI